jgi:hypothetical protein
MVRGINMNGLTDTFNIIANMLFSATVAGTIMLLLFYLISRKLKYVKLDGIMLKLSILFTAVWVIDIGLYIYLSIMI